MDTLTDNPHLADQWHVVCEGADLAAGPVGVTLLGRDYVVWRAPGGEVVAAPDRCPHRESPLSLGHVADGCLVCPYHGWTFDGRGACVAIPSNARPENGRVNRASRHRQSHPSASAATMPASGASIAGGRRASAPIGKWTVRLSSAGRYGVRRSRARSRCAADSQCRLKPSRN